MLGGTVFLGRHIVDQAVSRGHDVTLFSRGRSNPDLFPALRHLTGDRDGDLKAMQDQDWDAVVDTSGYIPRVVAASARLLAPRIGTYLFVSTVSVYGDMSLIGMTEDAPRAQLAEPGSEDVARDYGALKALCECEVDSALPGRSSGGPAGPDRRPA